uniref:Uncharacterized protein n=1 Tax=Hyaloperonospora arabidopsidis (strain Emoy2) TaxID=559515 RepID=M4B695_HYAAE
MEPVPIRLLPRNSTRDRNYRPVATRIKLDRENCCTRIRRRPHWSLRQKPSLSESQCRGSTVDDEAVLRPRRRAFMGNLRLCTNPPLFGYTLQRLRTKARSITL